MSLHHQYRHNPFFCLSLLFRYLLTFIFTLNYRLYSVLSAPRSPLPSFSFLYLPCNVTITYSPHRRSRCRGSIAGIRYLLYVGFGFSDYKENFATSNISCQVLSESNPLFGIASSILMLQTPSQTPRGPRPIRSRPFTLVVP